MNLGISRAELVHDIGAIARSDLRDHIARIRIRTIARAAVYFAVKEIAKQSLLLERVIDKPTPQSSQPDPFLAFGQRVSNGGAYAEVALQREAEAVEAAALGQQEHILNAAALKIGSLVGANALDYDTALDALTEAGLRMANDPNRKPWTREQIAAKVAHGLRDGMAQPREIASTSGANSADEEVNDSQYKPRRFVGVWASTLRPVLSRRDLVKGLIPRKALTVCWGAPSSGKTFWDHKFSDRRPFFCQIEAVETVIWLTEVAPKQGKEVRGTLDNLLAALVEIESVAILSTGKALASTS